MILTINGKSTSGMSLIEFDLELEMPSPRLLLTVSRYKSREQVLERIATNEQELYQKLETKSKQDHLLGWVDVAGGLETYQTPRKNFDSDVMVTETDNTSRPPYSPPEGRSFSLTAQSTTTPRHSNLALPLASLDNRTVAFGSSPENSESGSVGESVGSSVSKNDWSDDKNACVGCVCGAIHKKSDVFWIQCESCDTWYNVAVRCVGFSQEEAKRIDWQCPGCAPV
jgi:hypothetical protein